MCWALREGGQKSHSAPSCWLVPFSVYLLTELPLGSMRAYPCEQSLNAGTCFRSCPALTSSGLHSSPALCTCPHEPGLGCRGSARSCRLGSRAVQPVWGLWLNLTSSLARLRRKGTVRILFPGSTPGRWKGFQLWPTTKHTVLITKLSLRVSWDLDPALLPENSWK